MAAYWWGSVLYWWQLLLVKYCRVPLACRPTGTGGTCRCYCFVTTQTFPVQGFTKYRLQSKQGMQREVHVPMCKLREIKHKLFTIRLTSRSSFFFAFLRPRSWPGSPGYTIFSQMIFTIFPQRGRGGGAWGGAHVPIYHTGVQFNTYSTTTVEGNACSSKCHRLSLSTN